MLVHRRAATSSRCGSSPRYAGGRCSLECDGQNERRAQMDELHVGEG